MLASRIQARIRMPGLTEVNFWQPSGPGGFRG